MDLNHGRPLSRAETTKALRVPGFTVTLGRHAAGSSLPRHSHNDPTICFVLAGGFSESSTGRVAECLPDVLKLTPAGDPHANRFGTQDTRGLRIDVDRTRFDDLPPVARALDERYHRLGGRGAMLARRLAGELAHPDAMGTLAVEGLALELVAELARVHMGPGPGSAPRWLRAAEEVVRAHYRTAQSVAEVATIVGVHPATLARGWRRH